MAFASSSSTTSKPVIAIQTNSYYNLGPDSEQQKSPTLTRHARHAEQHDDNARPLPLQQSSFQPVYDITAESTNLSLGCPASRSTQNISYPNPSLNDVKKDEPYLSSALSSPESPTDNNFLTSVTSKNEVCSPHSKNYFVFLSIIHDLKRLNPAILLRNSGSVARDHLASERTFLAYVHTSLSLSSAGVVIIQLLTITDFVIPNSFEIPMLEARMRRYALPLGIMTQVVALYILFLGEWFYSPPFFFFFLSPVFGEYLGLTPLCLFSFRFFSPI